MSKEMKKNPDGVMEEVIWVPIKKYEGIYSVNQFGEVKSHARKILGHIGKMFVKERILKYGLHDNTNIRQVFLNKNGVGTTYNISRLVAEAFLGTDKDDSNTFVVHKSNDLSDDYYKNLLPVDKELFYEMSQRRINEIIRVPVHCTNSAGKVMPFETIRKAAAHFRVVPSTIVNRTKTPEKYFKGWKFEIIEPTDKASEKGEVACLEK